MIEGSANMMHGPIGPVSKPRIPRDIFAGPVTTMLVRVFAELFPGYWIQFSTRAVVYSHAIGSEI